MPTILAFVEFKLLLIALIRLVDGIYSTQQFLHYINWKFYHINFPNFIIGQKLHNLFKPLSVYILFFFELYSPAYQCNNP